MFKAKLIENDSYYDLRSKQLLLTFIISIPMGMIVNYFHLSNWVTLLMIGVYILMFIFLWKNQKKIQSIFGNKKIEMSEYEIKIESKNGIQEEIINLKDVDKFILKEKYSMPQETVKEVGSEMVGITKQNYLILQHKNHTRKLDFEVESYYMIKQLNKLIKKWELKGYNIEKINQQ